MLQTLRALDFRCWGSFSLEVPPSGGIFVGNNAQGKTSILEAVCVLLRLQSPRTHKHSSLSRFHTAGFGIAAEIHECQRKVRYLQGSLVCEVDGERRATNQEYLRDSGLVVWMGNDDLELIRGGGETRRRYLDFLGSQWDPSYRSHWSRYRRALKMKNALLKSPSLDDKQILAWEEIMIDSGTILAQLRHNMLAALTPLIAEHHAAVGGKAETISLEYRRSGAEDLRAALLQARERERRTRQSVIGPHRDDIALHINGLSAAEYASEGQQRTFVLALKLGQGTLLSNHCGHSPIYLIDDVFGELDPARRNALMQALPVHAQKWITTTHLDWLEESGTYTALPRFTVAAGNIMRSAI
jgi:DNA replication and repair protein RecF